jgi:Skp family chaperone for outer membrane proteins
MKKSLLTLAALLMMSAASYAQKFCYVDMEFILGKVPQYADAQKELDKVSQGFQKDIEAKRKAVDDMFKQYQSEQVLMTDQMKQQKMKEIETAEKEVKDLQKKKFGRGRRPFSEAQRAESNLYRTKCMMKYRNTLRPRVMTSFLTNRAARPCSMPAKSSTKARIFSPIWDRPRNRNNVFCEAPPDISEALYLDNSPFYIFAVPLLIYKKISMRKIIVAIVAIFTLGAVSAQQKIRHLNSAEILQAMPEYKTMSEAVDKKKQEYAKIIGNYVC